MRTVTTIFAVSLLLFPVSSVPAEAGTIGAKVWSACSGSLGTYNGLAGAKSLVGGFNRQTGRAWCFWAWNVHKKRTSENAYNVAETARSNCRKAGYDTCITLALNGDVTPAGSQSRHMASIESRQQRQRPSQNWNDANTQQVMDGFVQALGVVSALNGGRGYGGSSGGYSGGYSQGTQPAGNYGGGGSSEDCDYSTGACSAK